MLSILYNEKNYIARGLFMKFHHISLRVTNFEKSLDFYQTLTQLKVSKQFSANGGNVAYLHNAEGETEVELIAMPEGQTFEGKGMFLYSYNPQKERIWNIRMLLYCQSVINVV